MTIRNELGRLEEVDVRSVWRHEAQDFTPWLADHLDQLGEAIGLPLELQDTEVAVESFAADILARDTASGANVLIENQLTKTDHSHLGQILTYLAGLEARRVIWVAPSFTDAHLSAIRWLNDHTSDDFAFFAVRLRVVRIGNSPCAPVFEVLARPSEWERRLSRQQRSSAYTPEAEKRLAFWEFYMQRHPQAAQAGLQANRHWTQWLPVHAPGIAENAVQVILSIGTKNCGIYVRGDWGENKHSAAQLLAPHLPALVAQLGLPENHYAHPREGHVFGEFRPFSYLDENSWPQLADWLEQCREAYTHAIGKVLRGAGETD